MIDNNESNKKGPKKIFVDTGLQGITSSKSKNIKSKKTKIIIGIVIAVVILIVAVFLLLANTGKNNGESLFDKLEIDDSDVKQADNYLFNKYSATFTRTQCKYDSKEIYKKNNTIRISIEYSDTQGYKFTYRTQKFEGEDWKPSDNYQCLQYRDQIDNIVKSSLGYVESTNSSATGTSKKFSSIEDFYNNYKEFNFVLYLKQDEFGELNTDTATDLSKKILTIIPFKECSFMYSNIYYEEINGINYSRHTDPINISYYNNEFFVPSMEHVQEKADALNKALDEEIEKSKNK